MKSAQSSLLLVAAISIGRPAIAQQPTSGADPDVRQQCAEQHFSVQSLRREGQIKEARLQATLCLRDECPALLREECGGWLKQLEQEQPRISLVVRDASGHDLTRYRVHVDGERVTFKPGQPIDVDPGSHQVEVTAAGYQARTIAFEAVAGEGLRALVVEVERADKATKPNLQPPAPVRRQRALWPAYVVGGFGLALGAGATVLGVTTQQEERHLRSTCASECSPDSVSDLKTRYAVTNIGLGLAGASLVGAAILWWLAPSTPSHGVPKEAPKAAVRIDGSPSFATISVSGHF